MAAHVFLRSFKSAFWMLGAVLTLWYLEQSLRKIVGGGVEKYEEETARALYLLRSFVVGVNAVVFVVGDSDGTSAELRG